MLNVQADLGFKKDILRLKVKIDQISFLLFQECSGGSPALYDSTDKLDDVFKHISHYRKRLVDELAKHADARKHLSPLPFASDEETFCSVSLHFAVQKWRQMIPLEDLRPGERLNKIILILQNSKTRTSIPAEQYIFLELRQFFYRTLYIPCCRLSPSTHERLRSSYQLILLISQAMLDIEKCCQSLIEYYSYWEENLRKGMRQLKHKLQPELKIQMLDSWQLCGSAWETIDAIILNERMRRNVSRNRAHTVPETSDCTYSWSVAKKDTSSLSALPEMRVPINIDPKQWPALARALEREERHFDSRHPEMASEFQQRPSQSSSKPSHGPSRPQNKGRTSAEPSGSSSTIESTPPTSVAEKSGGGHENHGPVPHRLVRAHTTPSYLENGLPTARRLPPQDRPAASSRHVSQVGKGYHQSLRS